jgi:hypothetical protein
MISGWNAAIFPMNLKVQYLSLTLYKTIEDSDLDEFVQNSRWYAILSY